MKEAIIRKKAREEMEGWVCWCPPKAKFQETDIFGIVDMVCAKGKRLKWIQYTTLSNISARKKKIQTVFKRDNFFIPVEVWGYDKKKKCFKKIKTW